jgi:hypothetical protein
VNEEISTVSATPNRFRIKPHTKWIVGRIVDINVSRGGIQLVTGEVKGVTVFLLVDEIGPDVKHAKVGEIILYKTMNHVITRDGQRRAVVIDDADNIIGTVEDLDMEHATIIEDKPAPSPEAPLQG